jgi:diaminopimelate decarboxylase
MFMIVRSCAADINNCARHCQMTSKIYYAVKANPNIRIIRELGGLYGGVDIASKGEMIRAIEGGIKPEAMSFAGPRKSIEELRFAIKYKIGTISVESAREIEHIREISRQLNAAVNILIRLNPAFELAKSGMKMGGGAQQFGIDSERVPPLIKSLACDEHVHFSGIHIFAGSQNLNAGAIIEAFHSILRYAENLAAEIDRPLSIVNLGGGFGIPYFEKDEELDLRQVGDGLARLLEASRKRLPQTQFKIELGRYLVGECGLYVCKVLYRKLSRGQVFLVTDGGMHHHLAASGNFGQKMVHRPMPITVANKLHHPTERANLVGPLCTPLDTFGMNLELPRAEEGDLIAVFNSGAYGYSASPLGFLSHEPPEEIIL